MKSAPDVAAFFTSRYFYVTNCEKLESIEIDNYSFSDYAGVFELSNLPLLHTLQIGFVETRSSNFIKQNLNIQSNARFLFEW